MTEHMSSSAAFGKLFMVRGGDKSPIKKL
jgi:hypothetical protein